MLESLDGLPGNQRMTHPRSLWSPTASALLSACVSLVACGGSGDGPVGSGGAGGDGAGAQATGGGGSGGGGATVVLTVTAQDALSSAALEGVTVCVDGAPQWGCALTDGSGHASLAVPASTELFVSLEKDTYASALVGTPTGTDDFEFTAPLVKDALANIVAESGGVTLDPTKGNIGLAAVGPPPKAGDPYPGVVGVTFDLAPASGTGPLYGNDLNLIDPNLTATGARGAALFFNVDPGEYEVTASHATLPCTALLAITGSAPNQFRARVVANFVTYLTVLCDDGAGGAGGTGGAGGAGGG